MSSESQDVDLSISAQLGALRDYAEKHGYQVVREFIDEAESGRTTARPAFKEMIALAKIHSPSFEAILVWKMNRFSRSRIDSVTYKKLLRDRGIRVISINEPLDDTPGGQLLEGVIESVDEFYSANLGQDIKRGLREAARRGFFTGSRPPYGFRKIAVRDNVKTRHKLEPEPEDSIAVRTIRRIFTLAYENMGTKEIAKTLNQDGYRTSTGQRWGRTTVHKVLNNEAYSGTLILGGRPGHPALHTKEPPVRLENVWTPIIEPKMFRLVQEKMSGKKPQAVHPRTILSFYLLSGLLFCSCGYAMIGRSAKSHQYYYYTCNGNLKQGKNTCNARSYSKEKLEELIIGQVKDKILQPEWLAELAKLVNEEIDINNSTLKDKINVIDAELNNIGARLSKLYDALETGKLNLNDLAPRIKELKARQDDLSKTRILTEAEITAQGINYLNDESVKNYCSDLVNLLDESEIPISKSLLRSFVKRIVIDGGKVTIEYKVPVPPETKRLEATEVLPIATPSGDRGSRTPDLRDANAALSH